MMRKFMLAVVVLLVSLCAVWARAESSGSPTAVATRSVDECRRLGFLKADAKCQYCQPLLQKTGSAEMHEECLSCCTVDDQAPSRTYASARIELRGLHSELGETRSELGMFYQAYKEKFGRRLQWVTKHTAFWPRLVLQDEDGGEELEMSLIGWTKDGMHDYLMQALGMDKTAGS
ncbi:hypothetical protein DQ04_00911020 [Trypanosoma grayi]|uniref:hypothetical protein n=1 Tax=Trypanosoma grayi TaxID=71804 RepID=UPI0004F40FB4|nr:hypothetical protein DQ04_00911020 [Trypanosoma grayi]KEG13590.1 hypothetical protein DQ04_00911020 [Trypanosoma grayi]